jgi:pyridoxamine 5'-phosphate oxidase
LDLNDLRKEYAGHVLDVDTVAPNAFKQFESWFQEAAKAELLEPNAMVLSTSNLDGQPSQRSVLLKYFDKKGFVFFTNYGSRKATQIRDNPNVAVLFPWYQLQRQVEINGVAEKMSQTESMKYFALRPRGSQLGAWVSQQSSVVSTRSLLQSKLDGIKKKFAENEVPMPSFWGGFRIKPMRIEFWQGGTNRLHDRIEYSRESLDDDCWKLQRLSP